MKNNSVSILGCGWLGEALLQDLTEQDLNVCGSKSTREGVEKFGRKYQNIFLLRLETDKIISDNIQQFFSSDVLVVNISTGRKEEEINTLPGKMHQLILQLRNSHVKHVIFISSTSVYPFLNEEVDESCNEIPDKESGRVLLECEKLLLEEKHFLTTVIRFGGLIGYNRTPGKFLAGMTNIENGNSPVNLIHRDDCIGIIKYFVRNPSRNEIFNACAPVHPLKKEYYTAAAIAENLPLPVFNQNNDQKWKIVSTKKLIEQTGYQFIYPDPAKISLTNEFQN